MDALGPILAPAARAITEATQAPPAIAAQSVLAVASLVAQGFTDVVLPWKRNGKPAPISLFFLTIAESGERKSAVDNYAMQPIRMREKELRDRYAEAIAEHRDALEVWTAKRNAAKGLGAKGDFAAMETQLASLRDSEPVQPLLPSLVVTQTTMEALHKDAISGQPSRGLFTDEGANFVGGHSMTHEKLTGTVGALNYLWDASPQTKRLAGEELPPVEGKRFCMHLLGQPKIMWKMLANPEARGSGLIARCLVVEPTTRMGQRFGWGGSESADREIARFTARMLDILQKAEPRHNPDAAQGVELKPFALSLTAEAELVVKDYHDRVEADLAPNAPLSFLTVPDRVRLEIDRTGAEACRDDQGRGDARR